MPTPPPRRWSNGRLVSIALSLIVIVAVTTGLLVWRGTTNSGQDEADAARAALATHGPIATGVMQPAPSGEPAIVSADSVLLARPEYPYMGSAPWQIHDRPTGAAILEAYASKPSYLPGEMLRIAVSSSAARFDVTIWRVSGSGPHGAPFVKMASASDLAGRLQPRPTVDPVTSMVAAHWVDTWAFPIPDSWPSGVYLARLASWERVQSYVPFVVRSSSAHGVLVVSNALTWQAYNSWGGSDLYGTSVGQPLPGVRRALAVSFNRPYLRGGGAGQLFLMELPFLVWIDRQGLDVAYTTDYDLSIAPDAQPIPQVTVFNGHSEYWGKPLYDWLDRHVNRAGEMGLGIFAADTGYWPASFGTPSVAGPRSFTCLKEGPVPPSWLASDQAEKPVESPGDSASPQDEEGATGTGFRALGPDGPYVGSFADEPLLGVRYRGITTRIGRYTIMTSSDPGLLDGTGLVSGASLGFIAGGEVDGVYPFPEWWGPLNGAYDHVFAEAARIRGKADDHWTAQAVWRELPNGGRVFSAGTFYWGWALDRVWGPNHDVPPGFAQLTANIIKYLGHL